MNIAVHLFFVDGQTCSIADAIICLTKNQTASFLASDLDPGTTGYLVAVASDPTTGCPVNFNFLIGDAYVKLASSHQANLGAENLATGASTLTDLLGLFYDDAENAVSFTFSPGVCQFRSSLSGSFPRTTPRLETFIPAGRTGWLRLYSTGDIGMLGAVLNFNSNAQTNAGAFNQGRNLHKLTLTSTQTLVIPIFPPNCLD